MDMFEQLTCAVWCSLFYKGRGVGTSLAVDLCCSFMPVVLLREKRVEELVCGSILFLYIGSLVLLFPGSGFPMQLVAK